MPVMATLFLSQSSFHTINHYFTSLQCSLPWTCTEAPCESPRSPCLHARFVMRAQEPTKLLHLPFWVPWVDCSLSVCQLVLKPAVVPIAHRLMFPQRAKKGHKLFLLKNLPEISKQSKSVKGLCSKLLTSSFCKSLHLSSGAFSYHFCCPHPCAHTIGHYYIHALLPDCWLKSFLHFQGHG